MTRREYKGGAAPLALATSIDADDTTIVTTGDVTGWPTGASYAFFVRIGSEKILCSGRTGNTLTVAASGRGADGTTAATHTLPATVEHVLDAGTVDEVNALANDTSLDRLTQYLNVSRHDTTSRHLAGTSIPVGSPAPSAPGDSASDGVSTSLARADHKHAREAKGLVGDIVSSEPGDTAVAGASGRVADAAHQHAREAWGLAGDITTSQAGDTALAGSTGRVADAGHRHPRNQTLGLASVWYANDGDTGAITAGSGLSVATYTLTTSFDRTLHIHAYCLIRNNVAAGGSFAGTVAIRMNGSAMFAATRRFSSYPMSTAALPISFPTMSYRNPATFTVDLYVSLDVGSADVVVLGRALVIDVIGGP